MNTVIGWLLPIIAGATVILVLYYVMKEQHDHEEYYIPPPSAPRAERQPEPSAMNTAEITGTEELSASPIIDEEAKRKAEEERE